MASVALLGVIAVGCGRESETLTAPTAAPTTAADTTVPVSTAPQTTAPPTIAPPTTAPATTAPATTAAPTTEPPAITAPPITTPAVPIPATAMVRADGRLLEVNSATGETVRVIADVFQDDGVFRGGLRFSPDRSTIWYSEGYEDSWYACETSVGSWGRVDAATGAQEILGLGSSPEPSDDGEYVAYITSSVCLPDPESPDFWVLTPADRVVVRQLSTGDEREFVTETSPDSYEAASVVQGALFSGDNLLVLLGDGRLFDVDVNGSTVIEQHPVALVDVTGFPVSGGADHLLALVYGDEGSTDLVEIDAASAEPRLVASSGAYMAVGFSAGGQIIVSAVEPVTVADGAPVTVLGVPGDAFVFDVDW